MGFGASREKAVGLRIGAKRGRMSRRLTVTMGILVPKDLNPDGDALGERIRRRSEGDCASSVRGMTGSSVRKSQQPPSLERLRVMLRRW